MKHLANGIDIVKVTKATVVLPHRIGQKAKVEQKKIDRFIQLATQDLYDTDVDSIIEYFMILEEVEQAYGKEVSEKLEDLGHKIYNELHR